MKQAALNACNKKQQCFASQGQDAGVFTKLVTKVIAYETIIGAF